MRIVIDGRMLGWTGVGRYTSALLGELEQLDHDNDYQVLVRPADWNRWEPAAQNFKKVRTDIDPYTWREQFELGRRITDLRPDLTHFTAPNAPALFAGRRVTSVHDLTLLDYDTSRGTGLAKALRGLKRIPFGWVLRAGVRRSAAIITPTEYVRNQVVTRLGAPPAMVKAIALAADPYQGEPEPLERLELPDEFLLYVGNMYPYKNIAAVIRAMAVLGDQRPELGLVVAGKPDAYTAGLKDLADELGVSRRVHFTGYVSDGELAGLYRAAAAYVNPSLSEGFGLQGLEAWAHGTPVLAARASCLPEVYGEAAHYFDPRDPAELAEEIARVLSDMDLKRRLATLGKERLKLFSWRRMAEETLEAYKQAGSK